MIYFYVVFGGSVDVKINRDNEVMIGERKCEILGKTFDLENNNIVLDLRIIGEAAYDRITTYGDDRFTTYSEIRKAEVI
jgi:hypothetical protein